MINIKPIVKKELDKVSTNVNDTYPSNWTTFPVVQYVEEENKTHTKTDNEEQLAYVRYKIDIWHNRSTSDTAVAVDEILSALGLIRTQSLDVPEPSQLKHKVMRFEAIVNVKEMSIYN